MKNDLPDEIWVKEFTSDDNQTVLEAMYIEGGNYKRYTRAPLTEPVINDVGLNNALDLINKHGFEMIDPSLYGAVKTVISHASEKKMVELKLGYGAGIKDAQEGNLSGFHYNECIKIIEGDKKC